MPRASFHQADIERIIKAARRQNCIVQVDLKTLVVTIFPHQGEEVPKLNVAYAQDGPENWEDEDWSVEA